MLLQHTTQRVCCSTICRWVRLIWFLQAERQPVPQQDLVRFWDGVKCGFWAEQTSTNSLRV